MKRLYLFLKAGGAPLVIAAAAFLMMCTATASFCAEADAAENKASDDFGVQSSTEHEEKT